MCAKHTALILTAGFLLLPTLSWSQFPGMGGPGGGRFGGNPGGGGAFGGGAGGTRMQFDPDRIFNMISGGKDVIDLSQLDPNMRQRLASRYGVTGNQITRDQFKAGMAQRMSNPSGQFGGTSFQMSTPIAFGSQGSPMAFTFQSGSAAPGGIPGGDDGQDRRVEEYFKKLDLNQNGVLEHHELVGDPVAEDLSREIEKYDKNQDGFIDLAEFKAYLAARKDPQDGKNPLGPKPDSRRKRPTVIRGGNLPADFPFASLDRDGDGQIGLYEWKESGKRISEFLAMDLNNDGFLTVDEFTRWKKVDDEANGRSNSSAFARGKGGMPGMPGFGGANMFATGAPGGGGGFGMGMPGFGGSFGMPGFGGRQFGAPGGFMGGNGGPQAFGSGRRNRGGPGGGFTGGPGGFSGRGGFPGGNGGGPGGFSGRNGRGNFGGGDAAGASPGGPGQNRFGRFGGTPGATGGPAGFTPGGGSFNRPSGPGASDNGGGGGRRRGGRGKGGDFNSGNGGGKQRFKGTSFGGKNYRSR